MQLANPSKALIALIALISMVVLPSCANRERLNCPRLKNQALTRSSVELAPQTLAPTITTRRCG